eukprot:6404828-Alexandrium_andersonii.AAC.1
MPAPEEGVPATQATTSATPTTAAEGTEGPSQETEAVQNPEAALAARLESWCSEHRVASALRPVSTHDGLRTPTDNHPVAE